MSFWENLQQLEQQESVKKTKENSEKLDNNQVKEKEFITTKTLSQYCKKYGLENTEINIQKPKNPIDDLKKDFQTYVYPYDKDKNPKTFDIA
jgi:hypothetical protein